MPIASPNSFFLNQWGMIAAVPIVKKQLPKPIITAPKAANKKTCEDEIMRLPNETQTIAKNPIVRNWYLFIKKPAGSAINRPGITVNEIKSPAVPAPTLKADSIFIRRGGID
jgi:hypothetical protein